MLYLNRKGIHGLAAWIFHGIFRNIEEEGLKEKQIIESYAAYASPETMAKF